MTEPLPIEQRVIKTMLELIDLPFDAKIDIMAARGEQYEALKKNAQFYLTLQNKHSMEDDDLLRLIVAMGVIQSRRDQQAKQEAVIVLQALGDKYEGLMDSNK